jgi:tetratricopeptide (TPR) repeat protein
MKYFYLLCFTLLLYPLVGIGQNRATDSLQQLLLHSSEDTNKVILLDKLFTQLEYNNIIKSKESLDKAMELSQKISWKKGIATCLKNSGYLAKDTGNYIQALIQFKKALATFEEIKDKNGIASSYNAIGEGNRMQGNYSEALRNYRISLKIKEELGDKNAIAGSHSNIPRSIKKLFYRSKNI